jgi:hypothetical protein
LSNTVFSLQFLQIPQGVQLRVVVVELTFFHYGRKKFDDLCVFLCSSFGVIYASCSSRLNLKSTVF